MRPLPTRLLPDSAEVIDGVLHIGGRNTLSRSRVRQLKGLRLRRAAFRDRCREAVEAFGDVAYATKAFLRGAMAPRP